MQTERMNFYSQYSHLTKHFVTRSSLPVEQCNWRHFGFSAQFVFWGFRM